MRSTTACDDQHAPEPLTVETAMERRDALIARLLELTGPAGRDLISDLLAAEGDLDATIRERIRAREALRT